MGCWWWRFRLVVFTFCCRCFGKMVVVVAIVVVLVAVVVVVLLVIVLPYGFQPTLID